MAIIELVDRNIEAKKVDLIKKEEKTPKDQKPEVKTKDTTKKIKPKK